MDKPWTILEDTSIYVYLAGTLRSCRQSLLTVPYTRMKTKGERTFCPVAPRLWNSTSMDMVDSTVSFKDFNVFLVM